MDKRASPVVLFLFFSPVCETLYKEHDVSEDFPVCSLETERVCEDAEDPDTCAEVERKVCTVESQPTKKIKPDAKVPGRTGRKLVDIIR